MRFLEIFLKYHGIQALRGAAALAVVLHHLDVLLAKPKYFDESFLGPIAVSGFRGVDLFFVISGFIMMYTSHANPDRTRLNFARNRIARIFVPYLPVFLVMTLLYMAVPSIAQGGIEINAWYWVQNLLLLPREALETYVPVVAWTLTFELTFYIFFAVTIFKRSPAATVIFSTWMAACFLNIWLDIPLMMLSPLNLGFGIGVLSYLASQRIPEAVKMPGFFASCGVFVLLMFYSSDRVESDLINLLFLLVSGVMCATSTKVPDSILSRVGDFSYSLYLCHYPLLAFLFIISFRLGLAEAVDPYVICGAFLAAALFLSWCYYSVVEVYLYRKLNRKTTPLGQNLPRGR